LLGAGYQTGAVNGQHRYIWLQVNGVVRCRLSDWSGKWAAPVCLAAGECSCYVQAIRLER